MGRHSLYWSGIDAETGNYLFPPATTGELAELACAEITDRRELARLERWLKQLGSDGGARRHGGDRGDLAQAGWGVIFAARDPAAPRVREALGDLLAHRRGQAAHTDERRYQEFTGERGYRPGESRREFLSRHGAAPGAGDPGEMPHYLLLVGDPEAIPWSFQYALNVDFAVGRICFDSPQEYTAYARSVVAAETVATPRSRRVVVFAPHYPGDTATRLSAFDLAKPLAAHLTRGWPAWDVALSCGEEASKARLSSVLHGKEPAALLFAAGHGLGFPSGHPLQRGRQGALLCQDFPGAGGGGRGPVAAEHCFAADDVGTDAQLHGLITFHLACYSAGSPALGERWPNLRASPRRVAPRPFLSRLAQRLISHPRGGALAVVGRLGRAWQLELTWPPNNGSLPAFTKAFDRLVAGRPVGHAMAAFAELHAQLARDLAAEIEIVCCGAPPDEDTLARLWAGRNDCRSYVVVGDPAVRLATSSGRRAEAALDLAPEAAIN